MPSLKREGIKLEAKWPCWAILLSFGLLERKFIVELSGLEESHNDLSAAGDDSSDRLRVVNWKGLGNESYRHSK